MPAQDAAQARPLTAPSRPPLTATLTARSAMNEQPRNVTNDQQPAAQPQVTFGNAPLIATTRTTPTPALYAPQPTLQLPAAQVSAPSTSPAPVADNFGDPNRHGMPPTPQHALHGVAQAPSHVFDARASRASSPAPMHVPSAPGQPSAHLAPRMQAEQGRASPLQGAHCSRACA